MTRLLLPKLRPGTSTDLAVAHATDPAAHRRAIRDVVRRARRVPAAAETVTLQSLRDVRAELVAAVTALDANTPARRQYDEAIAALDRALAGWASRYAVDLRGIYGDAWQAGIAVATEPVVAAGRHVAVAISDDLFDIAVRFVPDLISGIRDDMRRRVAGEIAAVVTGGRPIRDAVTNIGRTVRSPGHLRTVAARARAIAVTEAGRVQATATHVTMLRTAETAPDLRKRWLNSRLPNARPEHVAADERYAPGGAVGPIPVDVDYQVAGYQAAYPRDPRLPAGQAVNCHCVSVPWFPDSDLQ